PRFFSVTNSPTTSSTLAASIILSTVSLGIKKVYFWEESNLLINSVIMVVSARSAIVFFSIFLNLYLTAQKEKAEENPYKRLAKSFIGAVKRGQHFKNTRFFDSS